MTIKRIIVSQKIKSFRRERRLTQEQFATSLGLSPQAISKWEREECYPDITFLPILAETLGCTVNDFFAWKYNKKAGDRWSPLRVNLRFIVGAIHESPVFLHGMRLYSGRRGRRPLQGIKNITLTKFI